MITIRPDCRTILSGLLAVGMWGAAAQPAMAGVSSCLVTPEEAEKVIGVRPAATEPRGLGDAEVCWYVGPADQNLRTEIHTGGRAAYEAYLRAFEPLRDPDRRPVRGVGDAAMWHHGQLTVLRDSYFIIIAIGMPGSSAERLRRSVGLARLMITRLDRLVPRR